MTFYVWLMLRRLARIEQKQDDLARLIQRQSITANELQQLRAHLASARTTLAQAVQGATPPNTKE